MVGSFGKRCIWVQFRCENAVKALGFLLKIIIPFNLELVDWLNKYKNYDEVIIMGGGGLSFAGSDVGPINIFIGSKLFISLA